MIFIIDNTKNIKEAQMTPRMLSYLKKKNISYILASDRENVNKYLKNKINDIKGIILTGGPQCLSEQLTIESINKNISVLLNCINIPILGICFGFQIMAASYGGKISSMSKEQEGINKINYIKSSPLLNGLDKYFNAYQSHKDKVVEVPYNFDIVAIDNKNNIV